MINLSLQKGLRDSVIAMNPSSQNNIFVSRNKATIRADVHQKLKKNGIMRLSPIVSKKRQGSKTYAARKSSGIL